MPLVQVVRTYLEMTSPADLRGPSELPEGCSLEREPPDPARYRQLYEAVGDAHHWRDRNAWSDEALAAHRAHPDVTVWALRCSDATFGYFELVREPTDRSTELAYFGLVPAAIGRGLGAVLLTLAVRTAWAAGAERVWLHTCTLDHPAALPNYLARGFRVTRTERYADLPRT